MSAFQGFASRCVRDFRDNETTRAQQLPLYASSSFAFDSIDQGMRIFQGKEEGHVYGRYGNPTIESVSDKITALETWGLDMEASGMLFSSGMAAISSLMLATLKSGDKILSQGNLYGGTTELFLKVLKPLGIDLVMTDLQDLQGVEELLQRDKAIRMLYFETPANPTLACVDIAALASLASRYRVYSAVDNTFCTPYLQQPFRWNVDFVLHSTTKFINGHGNSIAGFLAGKDVALMQGRVWQTMKLAGTNASPWEAWLVNMGMKTLELRMDRHCKNAQALAEFLENHPAVSRVNYTGLPSHPDHELAKRQMHQHGGMLSFELKGGLDAGLDFMRKIRFCQLAPTLGDTETLILHPASMSHINIDREVRERNGITDGLIRVSVGIETLEDIRSDLEQALPSS